MSRVLIWKRVFPGSEYDIFNLTDYCNLWNTVQNDWHAKSQNWGNKLWFQGIYSAIDTGENEYGFIGKTINEEQINSDYDFIVLPMANIFYEGFLDLLREITVHIEKIKIPVYVVACGVQADSYDDINKLILSIGEDAKRFIKAVYNTGGEFALRGYFTKEFFDRLGFHSAVVTGCPSLYQLGSDFMVPATKITDDKIKPVFNGRAKQYMTLMEVYSDSAFVDQDEFFDAIFNPNFLDSVNLKFEMNFTMNHGVNAAKYLSKRRIITSADMNDWYNYLKENKFNYSFGTRIHGTIMALLSGVPATIIVKDTRTQEMAEFFNIPYDKCNKKMFSKNDLLEYYKKMDYSKFNKEFKSKFSEYEKFLKCHGIVSFVNTNNKFLFDKKASVYCGSKDRINEFSILANTIENNRTIINTGNCIRRLMRRF